MIEGRRGVAAAARFGLTIDNGLGRRDCQYSIVGWREAGGMQGQRRQGTRRPPSGGSWERKSREDGLLIN